MPSVYIGVSIRPTPPIGVWVVVWVKQNGMLKSGQKRYENKGKPLISCEISGDLEKVSRFDRNWSGGCKSQRGFKVNDTGPLYHSITSAKK